MREKAETASPRRANNIRAYTLSVARFCRGEGLIVTIPFENAPARRDPRPGREPFPLKRFGDYYRALDEFARPLFLALAASGDRVSAICGIVYPRDVNLAGEFVEVTKKGGKRRRIPLSIPLLRAIKMGLLLEPPCGRLAASGAVFINCRGTAWNKNSFRINATRAWKKAGLPYFQPHSLRNMLASNLADNDANRHTISAALGHDNTATADIYVKTREQLLSAGRGLRGWAGVLMDELPELDWESDGARMVHQEAKAALNSPRADDSHET